MSRPTLYRLVLLAVVAALTYWIATHTYWAEEAVPRMPSGAALQDPFYAASRLARALGARASDERLWRLPPPNGIVVTADWDWDASRSQRAQLQQWVQAGGRLVTDWVQLGDSATFSDWTGITRRNAPRAGVYVFRKADAARGDSFGCRDEDESGTSPFPPGATRKRYQLCGLYDDSFLASTRAPLWQVADRYGAQALRIRMGKGSVTVVNGMEFTYLQLLKGENPWLFVAATELHAGDAINFLSDQYHASLVALTWRFGAPVIVLLLGALLLALWRAAPRFGPAMASPESARRSLAEQIRGTGRFLLRAGDGEALHAATVRALLTAAPRRISAFSSLSSAERISRLARASGYPADALAAAINYTGPRRANELRSAIALLEAARRKIISNKDRSTDGN